MVHLDTFAPDTGVFDTDEARQGGPADSEYSRNIAWTQGQYNNAEPSFFLGLSQLDCNIRQGDRLRVGVGLETIDGGHKIVVIGDAIERAQVSWVERKVSAKETANGTFGYDKLDWKGKQSGRCEFAMPLERAPFILIWLSCLDLNPSDRWRVNAYATDVTTTGFQCNIECPDGARKIGVHWLAVTVSKHLWARADIKPESFGELSLDRSGHKPIPQGRFKTAPSVLTGLTMIDQPSDQPLMIHGVISNTTNAGFDWKVEHRSHYANCVTFAAVSNDDDYVNA